MKAIALMLAIVALVAGAIIGFPVSADRGPEPIRHGHDACARCRMHIAEPGFAGEMRDPSGPLTKYDDVGCLLIALVKDHEAWVEAHDSGRLIPLDAATLVVDSKIRTPMAFGVIAFEREPAAREHIERNGGEIRSLQAVLQDGRLGELQP